MAFSRSVRARILGPSITPQKWSRSLPCLKMQIHKDKLPLWCWGRYWCIKIQCTMTNPYEAKHYRKYHWSLVNTRMTTLFCGISKILVKRPVEIKGHQLNEKQNVKEPDESEKSMLKVCRLKSEILKVRETLKVCQTSETFPVSCH